jgi:hypothetical protein
MNQPEQEIGLALLQTIVQCRVDTEHSESLFSTEAIDLGAGEICSF